MMWIYQIGIISLAIVAIGIFYQGASTLTDQYRYPPLGQLIDVGGYRLHIHSIGKGGPTVVFDAGMGGTSLGWSLVQPEIAKYTQACSFDRAGYAWSEETTSRRTSRQIAEELHTLLHKANATGPYILVGHSFGGCNALLFANLYPEETLGIVLVDSVHEEMLEQLPPQAHQGIFDKILQHPTIQWLLSAIGYKRFMGPNAEIKKMFQPLPEKIRVQYEAHLNKTSYTTTVSREMENFSESLSQLKETQIIFNDKPLIVITAGKVTCNEEGRIWNSLQKKLLLKSNKAKQIIAEDSDHMINHHQPKIIIDAILEMIQDHVIIQQAAATTKERGS